MYDDIYTGHISDAEPEFSFPRPLSVSEINEFIKRVIDAVPQLSSLSIQGEISNFKNHYGSGHFYFTLKDSASSVRCVMFKSYAQRVKFAPEDGMKVTVRGRISVFPRDGQYQVYCESMEPLGVGALFAAYEQLKKKLAAEGLFSESAKRPLPPFPGTVGVVTSATGAAVRDIINISSRRYPAAGLLIYPALVQGDGAVESIIAGIKYFNETNSADVIIIGRGGGSIEDLWAFNSEELAREIYRSKIPIISAVGHETDFTIADFVADVRAPTPSAAAEIALPDEAEVRNRLLQLRARGTSAVINAVRSGREAVRRLSSSRYLADPAAYIEDRALMLDRLADRLASSAKRAHDTKREKLSSVSALLNSLSPLAVLKRGYGVARSADGKILTDTKKLRAGDTVDVSLSEGSFKAEILTIN